MIAIRGAASAENSVQSIRENTMSMLNALLTKNNIAPSDIVSLVFSLTKDLTALNPQRLRVRNADLRKLHCSAFRRR